MRASATLVLGALVAACSGGEEPRHPPALEPLPSRPEATRPDATPAPLPADYGIGVDAFAQSLAVAWRRNPLPVAVLPAFSDDPLYPRGQQVFASGAGDWLAARALDALRRAEPSIEAWAPETVVAELARNNRSLRDVRATQDVLPLVALTDAGYLVYGNVEKETVGGRLTGQTQVRARLACVELASGQVVATCDRGIEAADAVRDLAARAERASVVLVGARAPEFTPSLDLEIELATGRALAKLLGAHRAVFAGKRCNVVATVPGADAGQRLAATMRSALLARLPRALPGKDAIEAVASTGAAPAAGELVLAASLRRDSERCALWLLAGVQGGSGDSVTADAPIDRRFDAELRRILP